MKKLLLIFVSTLCFFISPIQSFTAPTTTHPNQHIDPIHDNSTNEPNPQKQDQELSPKKDSDATFDELQIEAESYILLDTMTGMILSEKKKDEPRPPASMTKMMTAYLVLEQIQQAKIRWDEEVTVSKRAADVDEAQIFLLENEKITVKELFIGLIVHSANDAAIALAEHVAGSEEAFVQMMNTKAEQFGMKNTHFNNSSGLDHKDYPDPPDVKGDHVMSAYDTAILAQSLISDHPEILQFTTISEYTFHPHTDREQKVTNSNQMLPGLNHEYSGVYGIKTGYTQRAGYCFTGVVKQNGIRLISVVMGSPSKDQRFLDTAKLYDYGYQQFKRKTLVQAGDPIPKMKSIPINQGKQLQVTIASLKNIELLMKKGEQRKYTYHFNIKPNLQAPLKKGSVIGTVEILYDGKKINGLKPYPLITTETVNKANRFEQFWQRIAS